jgi:hypothetical protein
LIAPRFSVGKAFLYKRAGVPEDGANAYAHLNAYFFSHTGQTGALPLANNLPAALKRAFAYR